MALEQITFNIGAFNDADASGNNYFAGEIYEVFNTNDTLADIFSDAAGANPINQDGISNKSNASGEVVFYIDAGSYYVLSGGKRRDFKNQSDLNARYNPKTLQEAIDSTEWLADGGEVFKTQERITGGGGGAEYVTVLASSVITNPYDIIQFSGVPTLAAVLIFKPEMTGLEFGLISDFDESTGIGTDNNGAYERMMIVGDTVSVKYSIPKGSYLFTEQQTIRHNVKVDFNGSTVALDYSGTKNDSNFQMGNNTELKNIDRLLHRSASGSTFTTLGMVKIGEFYAEFNGEPSSGDNSLDQSYWEVKNVNLENIYGYMSFTPNSTYKELSVMTYITGGKNITTSNIEADGSMDDGELVLRSVIRTETGYDINSRRQGYDLYINNTNGFNLDGGTEDAVVTINGNMNTKISNVRGEDCCQILRLGTNGSAENQSSGLRGKNGVSINAENIVGINSRKLVSYSPVHTLAAINISGGDSVDLSSVLSNRTRFTVKGIYLQGLETEDATWERLDAGISLGDTGSYSGVISKINRPTIEDFEAYWFKKGMLEQNYVEGGHYSNGHLRYNSDTGGTIGGKNGIYDNIKFSNNNLSGNSFGFNSNGLSISTKRAKFNNCIFGDIDLGEGLESQLSSIVITSDDTSATFENCYIENYKTGQSDITKRGTVDASTTDIYIDQRCRGVRNISSSYPIAPDVSKYQGSIQGDGTEDYTKNCGVSKVGTGEYLVTFNASYQPLNTNYRVSLSANGVNCDFDSKSLSSVKIYTKSDIGAAVDADFDFIIWADTPTIQEI